MDAALGPTTSPSQTEMNETLLLIATISSAICLLFTSLWLGDVMAHDATSTAVTTADACFRDLLNNINYVFEDLLAKNG